MRMEGFATYAPSGSYLSPKTDKCVLNFKIDGACRDGFRGTSGQLPWGARRVKADENERIVVPVVRFGVESLCEGSVIFFTLGQTPGQLQDDLDCACSSC